MNTTPSSTSRISSTTTSDGNSNKRALVLAGGGAAGNAWELGLIAGLSDAGVDVTEADLIIGTSAGSTVAAQITSGTRPAELYAAILAEAPRPQAGDAGSDRGRAPNFSGPTYMEWSNRIIGSAEDASDMRRRMGAAALEMDASDGSGQTRWRDIVAARLPSQHWPRQPVLIAAVDAHTGVSFARSMGPGCCHDLGTTLRLPDHLGVTGRFRQARVMAGLCRRR
jgi:NTE family protein